MTIGRNMVPEPEFFTFSLIPRLARYGLLACALAGSPMALAEMKVLEKNTFYRVINEQGRVELKETVTPAEAKRGYSIVTLGGYVVKEFAPEMSDEEFAALTKEQRAMRDKEERELEQKLYDESLLLRYSSLIDLEAERKRKLREFDVRISILRNNLHSVIEKSVAQQAAAANLERRGATVPAQLSQNIVDLEAEMKESELAIAARIKEKAEIDNKYDSDGVRLEHLLARAVRR
ncbi:MAG: hypothetical protein HKO07_04860 [Pseudomonadales bacterium]|nr:hypothetical protein [Pseudomonadales bacterium]